MNRKKRKILIVTGSRGEYGYIRPIIEVLKKSETLEYEVLATNMHLLPEFGNSIDEFKKDGIDVDYKVYMALSGFTNITMVKSLGVFMLSMADIISINTPDIILLAGDRGEQLISAMVGAHLNIPVAHIQAGEVSGNVDGMTRHAIARYAHIHFASNEDAEQRLIRSGEEPFRIFRVGAPQLDELVQSKVTPAGAICEKFRLHLEEPIFLVVQHPVTEQAVLAGEQMKQTMDAVMSLGHQTIVIYPNNDAGSIAIQDCILRHRDANIRVERNLTREDYLGLMSVANVMIGNSSSGLLEAPTFRLPAVNIGRRQEGRFQGKNVINVKDHCSADIREAIIRGLSKEFRDSLKDEENPYGDGHSSMRIIELLENIQINEKLIYKRIAY